MLAGNPYKRSFDGSPMAEAIGINCIGGKSRPTKKHEFPTENCPVRVQQYLENRCLDTYTRQTRDRTRCGWRSCFQAAGTEGISTQRIINRMSLGPSVYVKLYGV